MQKEIFLSIITPSYNQGKYIERTVKSVLSQGVSNFEYIVVDGCSNDATLSILDSYQDKIRIISEKDKGQSDAINKGIKLSQGDIICWLNSDDIYYPGTLKFVEEFFSKNPDIDVLYGKAKHIDEFDKVFSIYPTEEWNLNQFKKHCFLSQPAVFFRRRVLDQIGLLNENLNFCMDYELWLRMGLAEFRFHHVDKFLSATRLYAETKTLSEPKKVLFETIIMLREQLGYVPSLWLLKYASVLTKDMVSYRFPDLRYNFLLMGQTITENIKWNGAIKGILGLIEMPWSYLEFFKFNRKVKNLTVTSNKLS